MDFGFLTHLSWREMLLMAIVLLALYILFAFLYVNRLRNRGRSAQKSLPDTAQDAPPSQVEPGRDAPAIPAAARSTGADVSAFARERARNEPPSGSLELRRTEVLEQDVAQLRREIGGLRAEVQALREEQRREIGKVQVAQNTSPFYSDAMQLATQGREAADISVLCGISRAEAELVVALARNENQE
jgi:hypothetical protein